MNKEKLYDKEIAPKIMEIAKFCEDNGLSFVCAVEYAPSKIGRTLAMKNPGLEMIMINHCAKTAPNIDSYMIGLLRYAKDNGIDTGQSMFLRIMETA